MSENIKAFDTLTEEERTTFGNAASWRVDGTQGDWSAVANTPYGTLRHLAIFDDEGEYVRERVDLETPQKVVVVPVRVNPDGIAESLILSERRVLLRNKEHRQGNVFIDNLPQGKVEEDETPAEAAMRETYEETGHMPTNLVLIGKIASDPTQSSTITPYYLAFVPYEQQPAPQQLDPSEKIKLKPWKPLADLLAMDFVDGKTIIGLQRAARVLNPTLLKGKNSIAK